MEAARARRTFKQSEHYAAEQLANLQPALLDFLGDLGRVDPNEVVL
jgi:hypothetical protein